MLQLLAAKTVRALQITACLHVYRGNSHQLLTATILETFQQDLLKSIFVGSRKIALELIETQLALFSRNSSSRFGWCALHVTLLPAFARLEQKRSKGVTDGDCNVFLIAS